MNNNNAEGEGGSKSWPLQLFLPAFLSRRTVLSHLQYRDFNFLIKWISNQVYFNSKGENLTNFVIL